MSEVFHFLQAQPFCAIFGVVAAGMALGKRSIAGISLGSVVCILIVGLSASIWSFNATGTSLALPDLLKTIFFNIFIFAMGVKIGPQFFAGLQRDGWRLVAIGAIVAVLAPIVSYVCGWLFDLPPGAIAGLMAGSNNSSATFGTASSAVQSAAFHPAVNSSAEATAAMLAAAFALTYTVSEVQYVLFMRYLPALARFDAVASARAFASAMRSDRSSPLPGTSEAADATDRSIAVRAYRLTVATVAGKTIGDIKKQAPGIAVELVRRAKSWLPLTDAVTLQTDDEVVISAPVTSHEKVRAALGPELPDIEARSLLPLATVDVVVTKQDAVGRTVPEALAIVGPGLYPNTVFRAGTELPLGGETVLKSGDVLRVSGTEAHLSALGQRFGQVIRATHTSDVMTLSIGLIIGASLGAIRVPVFGVAINFGAAAVLVTGIVFGWLKTRRPALGGPISEGARELMEVLGLNVFTAVLALNSGEAVYKVMADGPVWSLVISCLVVSGFPAIVAWWVGRRGLGLNEALLMGAIAGARQNTASLRTARSVTQSDVPGIGYPVPLAITTVALSVVGYFLALFT